MYSYYNQNIERINQQINDLERARNQMQMQQPTNLTQNFQISPQQQGIKFVNGIDEVNKELVINETMFLSKDYKQMFIKDIKGNVRTFELNEIIPKDSKDLMIEDLQKQINELKKEMSKDEQYVNADANE
jgi:hypothetical protein